MTVNSASSSRAWRFGDSNRRAIHPTLGGIRCPAHGCSPARFCRLAILILSLVVALGGFYASLDDWLGTRSYGPRYLVPVLPLTIAPLAFWCWPTSRFRRLLLFTLCLVSVAVQLPAVVVDFSRAGIAAGMPNQTVRRFDWQWTAIR
jgi:hypothetical protein